MARPHAARPPNPAVRAEPRGIGTARARDPLAREVKLLGALLGQVIVEQAGEDLLLLVERVRRSTIEVRRTGSPEARRALATLLDGVSRADAEGLIRAFSLYFQLTNLAEEKQRVRRLRQQARASPHGHLDGSIAAAIDQVRDEGGSAEVARMAAELSIGLVITAHPTEARRRTVLLALRRCYRLLDGLDDPRLTPDEDAEARRRLREEIGLLWQTSAVRLDRPTPIDEVRTAMAFFDESLYIVTPRLYRAMDRALDDRPDARARTRAAGGRAASDTGGTATRPPRTTAFLHWGSWVGGDRDGNPGVTAATTRDALRIQADHVLRGHEAVARRLMQTVAPLVTADRTDAALAARLAQDRVDLPEAAAGLEARFPLEPYRQRFGAIAERLRRTRLMLTDERPAAPQPGSYADPEALLAELGELADALVRDDLARVAWGDLLDFRWQVTTFGFHALDLELRQHSEVHRATLDAVRAAGSPEHAADREVSPGVSVGEVLETLRAMADLQARFGPRSCDRYVVSFTRSAQDVLDVLELADLALGGEGAAAGRLDVVPLFESAAALGDCDTIVDALLGDPGYRAHVARRGDRQEVMLGYSDSTKESGALAAAWMLYRAQAALARAADRHGVSLTLFHGRGGAIGRGGGPMNRAITSSAPGAIQGRLKLTEQGEVVADRYANPAIALRHLEQLTNAVLVASSARHEALNRGAEARGAAIVAELAEASRSAYRALVWEDPEFEAFFRAATPIQELAGLAIGSRPAARGADGAARVTSLESLRAIPWVFAWSQSRANLPGWFGAGAALAAFERRHGGSGMDRLRELYRDWSFFTTTLDTVELSLAKADLQVARRYARLAPPGVANHIWRRLKAEFERTRTGLLRVTGRDRLLDGMPVLQRSIALRNPYVDSLSELQVRLLFQMRGLPPGDPQRPELMHLVHLTVSGVAAGIQNTG